MAPRRRKKSCSPWPALPLDIAGEVLLRLPSYADRVCLGAVCRSWRASAAQHRAPPRLPCLVFGDGTFRGFPEGDRPFRLPAAAGYHGSCGEWLVFKNGGGYSLQNPFSKATLAPLPSLSCVRAQHHEPVQAEAQRVVEEYDYRGLCLSHAVEPEPRKLSVRKLVVCSAGLVAAVIGEGRLGRIALCRPGAPSWSVSSHDQWRRLKDMATHQGTLYAVDHNEDLLAVTVSKDSDGGPAVSRIARVVTGAPPSLAIHRRLTLHYLVDLGGTLLMVRREVCHVMMLKDRGIDDRFTVFKADFRSSRWEEVRTLGDDMALLVGRWCSAAFRVPDEHRREWAGSIYFLEDGLVDQQDRDYCLSACDYNSWGHPTHRLERVFWRDGEDLPATWLLPQEDTAALHQRQSPSSAS